MSRRAAPPPECPVCGASLPPRARACPECGADERTGWNEQDTRYDGLDLPDTAFEETPDRPRRGSVDSSARRLLRPAIGLLLIGLLLYGLFAGF